MTKVRYLDKLFSSYSTSKLPKKVQEHRTLLLVLELGLELDSELYS